MKTLQEKQAARKAAKKMLLTPELFDELKMLGRAQIDPLGREINNPLPKVIPSELERPPTLEEQIQRVLRTHVSRQAFLNGFETLEEANDFDIPDDFDFTDEPQPYPVYQMREDEPPADDPEPEPPAVDPPADPTPPEN